MLRVRGDVASAREQAAIDPAGEASGGSPVEGWAGHPSIGPGARGPGTESDVASWARQSPSLNTGGAAARSGLIQNDARRGTARGQAGEHRRAQEQHPGPDKRHPDTETLAD